MERRRLGGLLLVATLVAGSPDGRPALIAARRDRAAHGLPSSKSPEQLAERRLQQATNAVGVASRAAEAAKAALRDARREARDAIEELELARERAAAAARETSSHDHSLDAWRQTLRAGQLTTVALLIFFAFMNGLARRSLSSAGPSLVEQGLLTVKEADAIFSVGFEAFAAGKLLVVPTTLLLGTRRALLLQVATMAACCAAYLSAPASRVVQTGAWVVFRIFSAMAVSTMLPFVGNWFPRRWYGRIFALLFTGFQAGYLVVSYYWQRLLFAGKLPWRKVFAQCTVGFVLLLGACALWLREAPPPPPEEARSKGPADYLLSMVTRDKSDKSDKSEHGSPGGGTSDGAEAGAAKPNVKRVELGALMRKVGTRWVFWAMLLATAAYTPAVEYSTHVTSYLKEMQSDEAAPLRAGFVCLQNTLCEGRYRNYVFSYVTALLLGSVVYDRASQLDRAFLVVGLLVVNAGCWLCLALAEPDAPAAAWVKAIGADIAMPQGMLRSILRGVVGGAGAEAATDAAVRLGGGVAAAVQPILPLSGPTKTALASIAGATIALPSSLPFAIFSLDFGKEGAAVLSGLLSVVGSLCAFTFLRAFPKILRSRGWFGVHASLATFAAVSAFAMGAIMFSDSRKFARGYVIRSSLLNETVVTLHACSRPTCALYPMWRPGQRRTWGPAAGAHFKPHAPTSLCHHCGRGNRLVECSVDEAAASAALLTPFESCSEWIRSEKPLRKPRQGWAFANDPMSYPLAALSEVTDPEHHML